MAEQHQKEKLERKSSKSRLSKQDEVEEVEEEEEDTSPSSETSDATIVPAGSETSGETPGGSPENQSPEENKKLESQRSTDSDKSSPTQGNSKGKVLVRSKALRDDASPPPPHPMESHHPLEEPVIAISTISETPMSPSITISTPPSDSSSSLLSPTPQRSKRKLEKDSSQSSLSDTGTSPCLSREPSLEYKDSTGIDLEEFIKTTLNKNAKDRMTLLKFEKELCDYIKDTKQDYLKFPQMSSYHRMLVHRCAAFFGLDHNVDQSGKCVVVNRTTSTRIPDFKFSDHVREDEEPVKHTQILKRSSKSFDEVQSPNRLSMDKKSKSVEEREFEYEKAKKRIFNQDSIDGGTPENNASRGSTRHSSARSSKEDLRLTDVRPWSSTESSGYGTDTSSKCKPSMTKASSFGGSSNVTVISRDKSTSSCLSTRFSKTESANSSTSSNLGSPLARPPTIPSSPPPEDHMESSSSSQSAASPAQSQSQQGSSPSPQGVSTGLPFTVEPGQPLAIWVASTFDSIPPGVMIINPQTGQPYLNRDGSLYRYQQHHGASFISNTSKHQQSSSNGSSPGQVMAQPPQILPQVVPQPSAHPHIPTMVNTGGPPLQPQPYAAYNSEQKNYESSELQQQFSQMTVSHQATLPHQLTLPHQPSLSHQGTLTHQSSIESLPEQHPMGMPQQPGQQQPQQVYMMSPQGQYIPGAGQYYPTQPQAPSGPPQSNVNVRLVYPHPGGAAYTQIEGQPQHAQPQHSNVTMSAPQQTPGAGHQYNTPNGAYIQSWGPSAGTYPQNPNVYQAHQGHASDQQQQPQGNPNYNPTYHSSQYVPSSAGAGDYSFASATGGTQGVPPTNYAPTQGYHTTPVSMSSTSHIVNFAPVGGAGGPGTTNLSYQARSPPLQIPLNSQQVAAAVAASVPGGSVAPSNLNNSAAAAQYVGYTYTSQGGAVCSVAAPNARPQGIVTFSNPGVPTHTQSPPQHYAAMVRPNMQMNLSMQMQPSRTTPPPMASGTYSVPLMAAATASGQPVKVISTLERKHELYSQSVDHPYKDVSSGTTFNKTKLKSVIKSSKSVIKN